MFIRQAFADEIVSNNTGSAATDMMASGNTLFMSVFPIVLIFIVFYFMVIRPQNKRMIEHRKTINDLQKGDKVVTGGGLIATVKKTIGENEVVLELAEGVQVHAVKSTIMMLRTKAPENKEPKKD
jgi:preprotein translocase subunit YajC